MRSVMIGDGGIKIDIGLRQALHGCNGFGGPHDQHDQLAGPASLLQALQALLGRILRMADRLPRLVHPRQSGARLSMGLRDFGGDAILRAEQFDHCLLILGSAFVGASVAAFAMCRDPSAWALARSISGGNRGAGRRLGGYGDNLTSPPSSDRPVASRRGG